MGTKHEQFEWQFENARRKLYRICVTDLKSENPSTASNAEYGLSIADPNMGMCNTMGRALIKKLNPPVRVLDFWAAMEAARIVLHNGGAGKKIFMILTKTI